MMQVLGQMTVPSYSSLPSQQSARMSCHMMSVNVFVETKADT